GPASSTCPSMRHPSAPSSPPPFPVAALRPGSVDGSMIANRTPPGVSRMPFRLRPLLIAGLFLLCLISSAPLAAQTNGAQTNGAPTSGPTANGFPADGTPIVGLEVEGTVRTTPAAIERVMT